MTPTPAKIHAVCLFLALVCAGATAASRERLPDADARSRAILRTMQAEEARHAANARARGGADLPPPIPSLMRFASGVMKAVAYRV